MAQAASVFEPIDWKAPGEQDLDAGLVSDEDVEQQAWEEAQSFKSEEGPDPPAPKGKSLSPKMVEMRKLGRESRIPRKIWLRLLSASELDDLRGADNRIGMGLLYEAFCQNGNKLWLDPLEELRPIMDNLEKFQGEIRHLRSFIFLLVQLSREKISPGAFLRYVLRPRMNFDFNYRSWREKNFWALEKIALGLMDLRKKPPFNGTYLGKSRALVEQVLAKYVGKPLARFRTSELEQDDHLNAYFNFWGSLSFSHPFFLDFCRVNVFPFFYRLSGKIDLVQLVAVMNLLLLLEKAVETSLPIITQPLRRAVLGFSLYTDFEANMMARQDKGMGPYDMVRELKAFLQCVLGLLATNNGVYLTSWLAGVFHAAKDPGLAEACASAIPLIADDGGQTRYQCHLLLLLKELPGEREFFLKKLNHSKGIHDSCSNPVLGTPVLQPGLEMAPASLAAWKAAAYKVPWERIIYKPRPVNGALFQAARSKIRAEVWSTIYSFWDQEPGMDFRNIIPLLQNELKKGTAQMTAWNNQLLLRESEEIRLRIKKLEAALQIPGVLLKNMDYFNPFEGQWAAILTGARFAARFPGWGALASSIAQEWWMPSEVQNQKNALLKDTSADRPSPAHMAHHLNLVQQMKEAVHTSWIEKTRHLRPKVKELLGKVAGFRQGDWEAQHVAGLLDQLFLTDSCALDRARYHDALLLSEIAGKETLEVRHWEESESWRTGVAARDGSFRLLATWVKHLQGWQLAKVESDAVVRETWGQMDLLRLWTSLREVWESWLLGGTGPLYLSKGQWVWQGLSEMPQALAAWETKAGITESGIRKGQAALLAKSLG